MRHHGRRRPRGFSEKPVKPAWDLMLGGLGIRGREKREAFNDLSVKIATMAGLATCILTTVAVEDSIGLVGGAVAGIVAGGAAFAIAAHVLVRDRYFRP